MLHNITGWDVDYLFEEQQSVCIAWTERCSMVERSFAGGRCDKVEIKIEIKMTCVALR